MEDLNRSFGTSVVIGTPALVCLIPAADGIRVDPASKIVFEITPGFQTGRQSSVRRRYSQASSALLAVEFRDRWDMKTCLDK